MPTYAKSDDWLLQSSLLLEARPETVRLPSSLPSHLHMLTSPSPHRHA